jgi:hypothetical protein
MNTTTPLTRLDLRTMAREADEALKKQAAAEARQGRTRCRFVGKATAKHEFMTRLERLFPGCAVYYDPGWNPKDSYGSCYIIVDWT